GFRIFHQELNANRFGVPQYRPRLFVVGLNETLFPDQTFDFPAGDFPRRTVEEVIRGLPEPAYFRRGMDSQDIPYHPNHWTMMPKSVKLWNSTPNPEGRSFRRIQ